MSESYLTIRGPGSDEVVIQKSRFIGCAVPCSSEEEAQAFIRSIREKYRDARHCCYAYVIGRNSGIMRYSDDGEPGGTAGMPMMDMLKNEGRYFGGILLGTGGLVRAYTQGCKIALQAASVVRMELSVLRQCRVSYPAWNQIQYTLQNLPVILEGIEYSDSVSFRICTRSKDMAEIVQTLNNLTDGKAAWTDQEEKYMPWTI